MSVLFCIRLDGREHRGQSAAGRSDEHAVAVHQQPTYLPVSGDVLGVAAGSSSYV